MNNIINIENRAGKIRLNDSVHKDSADQLIDELEQLYGESAVASNMQIGDITCSAENALESVDVEINSPGGSVMEGQRIYNALKGISARGVEVITTVSGLAASMGSVILMAGDQRKMTAGSRIMIHDASVMAYGNADDLRKQSNLLDSISSEIAAIYSERTNGSEDEMRALMKDETWMNAKQARSLGFIDTIIKNGKEESEASNSLLTLGQSGRDIKSQPKTTMEIFKSKSTLKDENSALTAQLETSEGESEALSKQIETLQAEIITKDETISNDVSNRAELEKVNGELGKEVETLTASLEAANKETEDAKAAISTKAVEIAAAAGHTEAVKVETEDDVKNSAEGLHAQYKKLQATDPAAAGAFWRENKSAMLAQR